MLEDPCSGCHVYVMYKFLHGKYVVDNSGNEMLVSFIEAFDRINHDILLNKLHQYVISGLIFIFVQCNLDL